MICQEFDDHFEDEVDFTPPAEDTPSMQSPAEVYTLAVPPVPLPGPPHLQLPRMSGQKHIPFRHSNLQMHSNVLSTKIYCVRIVRKKVDI